MSTAPAGTSSTQPQRSSQQPGALAILTATAVGGVLGARLGKAPFLLAAGAAAYALLKPKRVAVPRNLPPPAPPPESLTQSQVEQWLSRQIMREEQAPVVELSSAPVVEPEEDYSPQSFLLDEADELASAPAASDDFAGLTEPMPQLIVAAEPPPEPEAAVEAPLPLPEALETPDSAPDVPLSIADSAWALGVEPLPSLGEAVPYLHMASSPFFDAPLQQDAPASKQEPPFSSMFSSAPVPQEEPAPPVFFATTVFQGAAFPDEISVPPPTELVALPADVAPEPEPVKEPPPAAAAAPEIAVELAAQGDASFDSPLSAETRNPWQTEPESVAAVPAPPPPEQKQEPASGPVVEAEIVLRPRAPTQNAVIAKAKFTPPAFFSAEGGENVSAAEETDAHFPSPLQAPRSPGSRTAWNSWWQGD